MSTLRFEMMSGGTISIALDQCLGCTTQACVVACQQPLIDGPLTLDGQIPALRYSQADILTGRCVECLACEQECQMRGVPGALVIELPIPGLPDRSGKMTGDGRGNSAG